jgi:hypothetical protein
MVGQRLEGFLKSRGLETADIPKVLGLFVAAKYATGAACLAVGLRYQPLQRIVLNRHLVLQSSPWAQQQRLRFQQALDRAKKYPQKHISQRFGVADVGQPHIGKMQTNFRAARVRLREASQRLLLKKQLTQQRLIDRYRNSWHGWTSRKYWQLADRLQNAAEKNKAFSYLSAAVGGGPKKLALGLAEGVLLAKMAMPLTAPLSLLLIVQMFKRPAVVTSAEECPEAQEDTTKDAVVDDGSS